MFWAYLDIDILDDPAFLDLRELNEGHPWRFLRLIQVAKKANYKGLVVRQDGREAYQTKHLAHIHDGPGVKFVRIWDSFLQECVRLSLIEWDATESAWKISDWRRWHRSPSDTPESINGRVKKYREGRTVVENEPKRQSSQDRPPKRDSNVSETDLKRDETSCNDTKKSREEKSRVGESRVDPPLSPTNSSPKNSGGPEPSQGDKPPGPPEEEMKDIRSLSASQCVPDPGVVKRAEQLAEQLLKRELLEGEHEQLLAWYWRHLAAPTPRGVIKPADLTSALEYGTLATRQAAKGGQVQRRWPHMLKCATNCLPDVVARRLDREACRELGRPDPGALKPPEKPDS